MDQLVDEGHQDDKKNKHKKKWVPKQREDKVNQPNVGSPSLQFIRKIYNLISFKLDKLEEIQEIEHKLQVEYNGDFKLAYSQCQNGNWALISK